MTIQDRSQLVREFIRRARISNLSVKIPMDGSFKSEIAIVGEAGGEVEAKRGIPFVGGAGKLLWDSTRKFGITRQQVYITNVVKRQVSLSAKSSIRAAVPSGELQHWRALLHWELSQLPNLRYIVALGGVALEALTGLDGINSWRGSVLERQIGGRDVYIVAANNPAFAITEPKEEVTFRFHIGKLNRLLQGRYKPHVIEYSYNPRPKDAVDWIRYIHSEGLKGIPVSYDIESLSYETACIGMAVDAHKGFCVNFRSDRDNLFSIREERDIRKEFQKLFADPLVRFIAQNGQFDAYWLWYKDRLKVHKNWFDTLLAHHTLYPHLPHNLGYLTTQYTDHPFYKDEGKDWKEGGNINEFWEYNIKDCCITFRAAERLEKELIAHKLDKFFYDHVMRLQPHLVRMTVGGVLCDTELKQRIAELMGDEVDDLLAQFHKQVRAATGERDYTPNPNSNKQMRDLYFRRLKLVGRGTSTDAANRERMALHPRTSEEAKEIIKTVDKYAKVHKFTSTYANSRIDEDNRFRCEYKQFGTTKAPGRLSSAGVKWDTGMNLQNQPERARAMFVADAGYGFGYFDLAQAEARVVGWKARIESWMEQFEKARKDGQYDCHRALASEMFDVPYEDVPKKDFDEKYEPTIRYIAKRCRHGLNYRMGPSKLAEETGLSLAKAESAYHTYHRLTPELRKWWARTEREVRNNKALYNAYGRRLLFMQKLTDDKALDSIIAFYPQSTIGDKVSRVIYLSEEDERWPINARIALNVHDALICLAPHSKIKTCLHIMKEHAEEPLNIDGEELIIPADVKQSQPLAWHETDEHVIEYEPNSSSGLHRWYGMVGVDL